MSYNYRSQKPQYRKSYSSSSRPPRNSNRSRKKYIDPSLYVVAASAENSKPYISTNNFDDFNLHGLIKKNLLSKGYATPSPIQDQTIAAALEGRDIIGIASTGTGKTGSFVLPILQKLITGRGHRALIVAPTRELAEQIDQECRDLARDTGIKRALLIGGVNMSGQLRALRERPQLVIGTPGRIKDHMRRGSLKLNFFNTVVLDEVDRMLDMGFIKDVTEILNTTNDNRQSMFYSATLDSKVDGLIKNFSKEPLTVSISSRPTSEYVHQDVIVYSSNDVKVDKLIDLLNKKEVSKVLVFDETQRNVEKLGKLLDSRGFSTEAIHGGRSQGQRKRALARFKSNEVNILVATDVAARGIDVVDITHVVNYSTPNDYQDYIHRIGRAGRAGRIGYALTFIEK